MTDAKSRPEPASRSSVQVELRESTSILPPLSASKRSNAESGTKVTFLGSSKTAAAKARQKSTSNPDQFPCASRSENPGNPWLTPQLKVPRCLTVSSVAAPATEAAKTQSAAAMPRRPMLGLAVRALMMTPWLGVRRHAQITGSRHHRLAASQARGMAHDDFRADIHARIEIDDIAIGEAKTARRNRLPDGFGLIGAVNAI